MVLTAIVLSFVAGCIGGFVNTVLSQNFRIPRMRQCDAWDPGWIGNVAVGGTAALVYWGLYSLSADAPIIAGRAVQIQQAEITFTVKDLVGSIVIGLGGGRILSDQMDLKCLGNTLRQLQGEKAQTTISKG